MLDKRMEDLLNDQINAEIHSSYLYLSMAAYFEAQNLNGFANWMKVQAQEELVHAMKFYHYIYERLGKVTLSTIEGPATNWESAMDAFLAAAHHEQYITNRIYKLVDLANELKDYASLNFLQWFVAEQVEEEASADAIVQRLSMIKDSLNGLLWLDKELGSRSFKMPSK